MSRVLVDRAVAISRRGGLAAQTPIGDPDDDNWETDDDEDEDDDEDDEEEPLQANAVAVPNDLLRRIIGVRAGIT